MRRWWLGILTFALVGAAGYLTKDFSPTINAHAPISAKNGAAAVVASGEGSERQIKAADTLDWLLPGAGIPLDAQLGGSAIPQPRVSTPAELVASDKKCRDRLRELGIIPNGPCTDVGDVVDNLATGKYRFNKPGSAILDTPFPLRLTMQTAEAEPVTFDGLPGTVVERQGKLAQNVQATLSGDDFEITPGGPQVRTFTRSEPVEWDWTLKPKSTGTKTLTIEVVANIQVGSEKHPVSLKTLHEPIVIQVTMFQRVKGYVADAGGIVVAAAALVAPLAVLIGLVPKVRKFLKDQLARFRRRAGPTSRAARVDVPVVRVDKEPS